MAGLRRSLAGLALAALLITGQSVPARAQGADGEAAASAIVTIDPERLFTETDYGARVQREIEARAQALATENRRIEAELTAEERELTERRPELPIDEFRALADAFDAKVDRIREEQDAKTREVQQLRDVERQRFFGQVGPVLAALVEEIGAAVVLDRRTVFLSLDAVDITDEAIEAVNREIGAGGAGGQTSEGQ